MHQSYKEHQLHIAKHFLCNTGNHWNKFLPSNHTLISSSLSFHSWRNNLIQNYECSITSYLHILKSSFMKMHFSQILKFFTVKYDHKLTQSKKFIIKACQNERKNHINSLNHINITRNTTNVQLHL